MRKQFEELKQSGQLPSPNGVGMRILTLTQEEDCSLDELVNTLQADPALTGRILKLASSAKASGGQGVKSLRDAAMRLGLRTVSSVALGFSLVSGNRNGACERFNYDRYWSGSFACGLAAQELSMRLGLAEAAEAFTCGLLARVGELALASCHLQDYADILDRCAADPELTLLELENEAFRINHAEVAESMFEEWGLPSVYGEVVMALSDPKAEEDLEGFAKEMFQVVRDAMTLSDLALKGDNPDAMLLEDLNLLRQRLEVHGIELKELCDDLVEQWIEWGAMLELPTEELVSSFRPTQMLDNPQLAKAEAKAKDAVERIAEQIDAADGDSSKSTGVRVLAVDDDPLSLRVLQRLLQDAGHEVHVARNGREALARTLKVRPQVVVTDWEMPDINGLDFCRALRRSKFGRRIYILILTGRATEDQVLEAFEAGTDDFVTKPLKPRLFMARLRAGIRLVKLQEQVERDQRLQNKTASMMARMNRQLKEAANTDFLTNLPNRRCAMEHFVKEWDQAERMGSPLSVLMLDIDHFKAVNDTYGHDTGDVVLRETARVLKASVRRHDIAARMGGEEFLVICPGADMEQAHLVAERIRKRIEENLIQFGDFNGSVTASIGVAENHEGVTDVDHLMRLSDEAVYASKQNGRNQVSLMGGDGNDQARSA